MRIFSIYKTKYYISFTLFLLVFASCQYHKDLVYPHIEEFKEVPYLEYIIWGLSVENRLIEGYIIGNGNNITLIIASIHGDERGGILLANQLVTFLKTRHDLTVGRKIIILPNINPDGFAVFSRFNARGIDLNRNFPALNRINSKKYGISELSEPESRIIGYVIKKYEPDKIITLHEPLGCVDFDGPAENLAEHISKNCALPVRKLGEKPGSLGSYAGTELNIPTITLELPKNAAMLPINQLWKLYGKALIASIVYPDDLIFFYEDGIMAK